LRSAITIRLGTTTSVAIEETPSEFVLRLLDFARTGS
jgi:hypothetical protein